MMAFEKLFGKIKEKKLLLPTYYQQQFDRANNKVTPGIRAGGYLYKGGLPDITGKSDIKKFWEK